MAHKSCAGAPQTSPTWRQSPGGHPREYGGSPRHNSRAKCARWPTTTTRAQAPVYYPGSTEAYPTSGYDIIGWLTDHYKEHIRPGGRMLKGWQPGQPGNGSSTSARSFERQKRRESLRNIMVTGGAGFIGSNFARMMLEKYPDYQIIVYDKMTYAGNLDNLQDLQRQPALQLRPGRHRRPAKVDDTVRAAQHRHHRELRRRDARGPLDRGAGRLYPDRCVRHLRAAGGHAQARAWSACCRSPPTKCTAAVLEGSSRRATSTTRAAPTRPAKAGGELMCQAYFETYQPRWWSPAAPTTMAPTSTPRS